MLQIPPKWWSTDSVICYSPQPQGLESSPPHVGNVFCFLSYTKKWSTFCLLPFLEGYECSRGPAAFQLGSQIPSFGSPPSHLPGGPWVLSLSCAWSWWDFSVLPSVSSAKHYKPGLRCQQIYDIDLNLWDMKSKHPTVLFVTWFFKPLRFMFSICPCKQESLKL